MVVGGRERRASCINVILQEVTGDYYLLLLLLLLFFFGAFLEFSTVILAL